MAKAKFSKEKLDQYYKKNDKGKLLDKVVIEVLSSPSVEEVVYGARSVNAQLPEHLKRHTEDWDIYTKDKPKEVAKKIEKALDEKYGDNYFIVEPAKHKGTYKVISRVTNEGVADITIALDPIEYRTIGRVNYATLDEQVERIKESLASDETNFRHKKDRETLQRIEISGELNKEGKAKTFELTPKKYVIKPKHKARSRLIANRNNYLYSSVSGIR